MRRLGCVAVLLALIPACGEELPNGSLLERPRVLGLRVEVEGDPGRASPRAAETVTLRWLVAGPEAIEWTAALALCAASPNQTAVPSCAADAFAVLATPTPTEAPILTASIPSPAPAQIVMTGALCAGGTLPDCDGPRATREPVLFVLPVATDDEPPNLHPTMSDERVAIDGRAWEPSDPTPPASGCGALPDSATLPRVTWREEEMPSVVTVSVAPEDREAYREVVFMETPTLVDAREEITVSHVASAGRFARLQSVVFDDDQPEATVEWRHPPAEEVPAMGLTVRFFFVARDGRGGMDWTQRSLCLSP